MPFKRKRSPLVLRQEEIAFLEGIASSRTEPYSKVKRAKMLMAYARGESISKIARKEQIDRPVVEHRVDKACLGRYHDCSQGLGPLMFFVTDPIR